MSAKLSISFYKLGQISDCWNTSVWVLCRIRIFSVFATWSSTSAALSWSYRMLPRNSNLGKKPRIFMVYFWKSRILQYEIIYISQLWTVYQNFAISLVYLCTSWNILESFFTKWLANNVVSEFMSIILRFQERCIVSIATVIPWRTISSWQIQTCSSNMIRYLVLEKFVLIQLFADNNRQRGFAEFIPMPSDVHPHSLWTSTCKKELLWLRLE